MLILSLDTTTRAGSVALVRDGKVLHEAPGNPAVTHAERLPADALRVLALAGIRLEEIDLFAVAAGPGSFTGLRIGIATVQGFAMAAGRKVVPVSVLEALARAGENGTNAVGAWMDAQRGQVFAALYGAGGIALTPATSLPPLETLDAWQGVPPGLDAVRFIGDGAERYAGEIRSRTSDPAVLAHPPLAGVIGLIAADDPARAVLPHAVIPIYVRRPDAELARDRKRLA